MIDKDFIKCTLLLLGCLYNCLNPPVTLKSDNTFYPLGSDPSNLNLHNMFILFIYFYKGLSRLIYVFVDYLSNVLS